MSNGVPYNTIPDGSSNGLPTGSPSNIPNVPPSNPSPPPPSSAPDNTYDPSDVLSQVTNNRTNNILSSIARTLMDLLRHSRSTSSITARDRAQGGSSAASSLLSGLDFGSRFSDLFGSFGDAVGASLEDLPADVSSNIRDNILNRISNGNFLQMDPIDVFKPAIEGTLKALDTVSKVAGRYETSRQKNIQNAQERLIADINTMVETPFKILNDAAENWYNVWDANLRKINATQGYTKSTLQNLMSSYADRLRQDNLSNVISASDITENLAKVLDSGLSGKVAEEFAYLATELNAAIPTQDFFSYSEAYASVAANQIRLGKSQDEAISYANEQIKEFASNVLYASRRLSGGFSSGLKNAETLFSQSVKIAQAAKTDNAEEISGVLTAVSAITGSIAPDLATSMTDAVFKAATGGNQTDIVALRSLAGINASNTEFLKALANNPQKIFGDLFNNLSNMQNMAPDAFMEVAEGLSSVFGVSMDAFARVDFAYLADAISNMDTNNSALSDNIDLLISGNTTTNAEIMRMQETNKYMIDEGLSLVLDNEAGRLIQQHMWDEQLAREMMEARYGVELRGAALEFLEGIVASIDNLIGYFLTPLRIVGTVIDIGNSILEAVAEQEDIKTLLAAGAVGAVNKTSMEQLTTRDEDLQLTTDLLAKFGVKSKYYDYESDRSWINMFKHPVDELWFDLRKSRDNMSSSSSNNTSKSSSWPFNSSTVNSEYTWRTIGKSVANAISATNFGNLAYSNIPTQIATATSQAQSKSNQQLIAALNSMSAFVADPNNQNKNYQDWEKSVMTQYKISDLDAAIKSVGLTKTYVQNQFATLTAQEAAKEKMERDKQEATFWENSVTYASESVTALSTLDVNISNQHVVIVDLFERGFAIGADINTNISAFRDSTISYMSKHEVILSEIKTYNESLYKRFLVFQKSWNDYFIEHKVYNSGFNTSTYEKVVRKEKNESETAVYALADALTKNDVSLLLDPSLQTNALLAQILKVVSALLAQNNSGVTQTALPSTLTKLLLNSSNI